MCNMKITTLELVTRFAPAIEKLSVLEISDFQTNYAIARNITKISSAVKSFFKAQDAHINKYVKKDELGKPIILNKEFDFETKEAHDNFISKKQKLAVTEIDLTEDLNLFV